MIYLFSSKVVDFQKIRKCTEFCRRNRVAVGDYELILWGIEAMPYILHLSISKPLKTASFDLFLSILVMNINIFLYINSRYTALGGRYFNRD